MEDANISPKAAKPDMTPYIAHIVESMFVATADQNYILARHAFFNEFDVDFFWLSLHALEKYMKATLLLNGQSAKEFGHDLTMLYSQVRTLHLDYGPLSKPLIEDAEWCDEPFD